MRHGKKISANTIQLLLKSNYSILQIANFFGGKIKYLPERPGERYASALTRMNLSNNIITKIGKRKIKNHITDFKKIIDAQKEYL